MKNPKQNYRFHAPTTGRDALVEASAEKVYVDDVNREEMVQMTAVLPLAPSASALPRIPQNLRICERCDQLIGVDLDVCPYCRAPHAAL